MANPVQITSNSAQSSTTNVKAFASNVTIGNLIFVVVGTNTNRNPNNITDSQGNTYTLWDLQQSGLAASGSTWFTRAGSTGPCTVTANLPIVENSDMIIAEYAKNGTPAVDVSNTGVTTSATSLNTGNITTLVATELIISWGYDANHDGSPWTDTASGTTIEQTTHNPGGSTLVLFDRGVVATGVYTDTVTATTGTIGDNIVAGIISFSQVSVGPPPLTANCNNPPTGYVNSAYTHTFLGAGGSSPYIFSISAGSLPPGLTLNSSSGVLSGTPTSAGTFNFTLKVTDNALSTATTNCSISVTAASAAPFLNLTPFSITRLQAMFDNTKSIGNLQMNNFSGLLYYFSKQQYPFLSANEFITAYKSDSTGKIWASGTSVATGINSPVSGTSSAMSMTASGNKIYFVDGQTPIDGIGGANYTLGVWTYDTSTGTFSGPSAGGPFFDQTGATAVVTLNNGNLLIMYTAAKDAFVTNMVTQSVVYNPSTNTWGSPVTLANYGSGAGAQRAYLIACLHDTTTNNTVLFFNPGNTVSTPNLTLQAYVLNSAGSIINSPSAIYTAITSFPINGVFGVPCITTDSPSGNPSVALPFRDKDQSGNIRVAFVDFSSFAQSLETAALQTDLESPNTIQVYNQQNQGGSLAFDFNGFLYVTYAVDNGILNNASSQSFLFAKSRGHSTTWSGIQTLFTSGLSREMLGQFEASWVVQGPAILLNLWDPTVNDQSGSITGLTSFILLPTSSNPAPPPAPFQIRTLRYEIPKKRWFPHSYADTVVTHYLDELFLKNVDNEQLLMLSSTLGFIYRNGGDTDNGTAITSIVTTPSMDGGDDRSQKLYVDVMNDVDGTGTMNLFPQFTNQTINGPSVAFPLTGGRVQVLQNISSLAALNLYRNIAITYQWTGGPDGPRVYVCEPAGYLQPYISTFFVTQYINLAFPGYKHHRRLSAGYISNNTILFTIKTQDGRTYGPYSLPSTTGQFQIITIMLDQDIKDKAFAYQIDGQGNNFALFPEAWTIETKEWQEPDYIDLAIFKT